MLQVVLDTTESAYYVDSPLAVIGALPMQW
jgi:hypothetical protein